VKVVCSFVGGAGHLIPQLPLLRALANAGHDLTLVGRESVTKSVPANLFNFIVSRSDRRSSVSSEVSPLVPLNVSAELTVVAHHFAGRAARESADAVSHVIAGADLLICDELDFGAMAVADRAGVPIVVVSVIASGSLARDELVNGSVRELREGYGVAGPPRLRGDLFIVPFAKSMRDPAFQPPAATLWMRPDLIGPPTPDGSIVVTLGTEFNSESGDLFNRILEAVGEVGAPTVVAIGQDLDPAHFGTQPPNVRVERFVDLGELIPRAAVVLHHGGSGLFMSSVLGGAPQIVFPMGADQPFTAQRINALGIGITLDAITTTPSEIQRTIEYTQSDRTFRSNVLAVRKEVIELPTAESLIPATIRLGQ